MQRRKIRGKKLLIVSAGVVVSMMGCGDDTVANLVAPPADASIDAPASPDASSMDAETPMDATGLPDAPVANLVAPPDASALDSGSSDGG